MKNKMQTYQSTQAAYEVREEQLNGKTYLVVPVTMMVEGVHSGSRGPLLHLAEELGKIPASWNGIPVTIGHPEVEGTAVSANSPEILQDWALGIVFHTKMENEKLKSEAWLEKDKLALNENLNDRIANGEIIEVSVGVFSEEEQVQGTWHNEPYTAVARNLRPDHLAILPNQTGACSVQDGCGLRTNSKHMVLDEKNQLEVLQQLKQKGFVVEQLQVNESLQETVEKVRSRIYVMDAENVFYYIEDIWDTYVVYRKHDRTNDTSQMYKQTYVIAADGSVELVGAPVVVRKKVEYEVVQTNNSTTIKRTRKFNTNSKKEENMANENCSPCVAKRVNALIANTATQFTEEDREWLETLSVPQLDKMNVQAPASAQVNNTETVTPEMAVNAFKETLKKEEDYLALMPPAMQANVKAALATHAVHKTELIDSIIANTEEGTWTKEELEVYEVAKLEKIAKTATKQQPNGNYSVMGAGRGLQTNNNAENDVPIMAPAGVTFKQ